MNKIDEAIAVLGALGLPKGQQNERSALTLLALLDLREDTSWRRVKKRPIRIHDMMVFMLKHYGREYAENSRETIRRQTIHQFQQAAIVVKNPDDPRRPTNSPNTVYAITDEALDILRKYGGVDWETALQKFVKKQGKLVEKYEKRKKKHQISVSLPNGTLVDFSPGKHNELQAKILEEFRGTFCPDAKVVYVGDAAKKLLYLDEDLLDQLKIPITEHDKLPDVVLYDPENNNLFLIEAVTAHGPLSPKRQIELEETLQQCKARRVYVSAFPDFREFKRHMEQIAWETEVWIENNPGHMIHFNGPQFFTVYSD